MTAIKPPAGPSNTLPHTVGELQSGVTTTALDGPDSLLGPGTTSPPASGVDPGNRVDLVELARAVERGQLNMAQAVDRLVEGTVGCLPGQLTDLERSELSALLRQAVETDPTLSALRNE
jgi:hypothetical protein